MRIIFPYSLLSTKNKVLAWIVSSRRRLDLRRPCAENESARQRRFQVSFAPCFDRCSFILLVIIIIVVITTVIVIILHFVQCLCTEPFSKSKFEAALCHLPCCVESFQCRNNVITNPKP